MANGTLPFFKDKKATNTMRAQPTSKTGIGIAGINNSRECAPDVPHSRESYSNKS